MPLVLPRGKRLAVSVGADFDAHSLWMGTFGLTSPGYLSRGEFGAEVGVPRLLTLLERHGVWATWCTPSHTLLTFPARVATIVDSGHEIAAHGCYHEQVPKLDPAEERRLMEVQLEHHDRVLGIRPSGYRSPAWDFSEITLSLLEEFGFTWDSSLMGRDFEVYRPCPVTRVDPERGNTFGPPSTVLEIPVSWHLDDFPALDHLPRGTGMASTEVTYQRWKDHFDFAYQNVPGGVLTLTVHPQTIARAHNLVMFDRLLSYIREHDGVWFATLGDVADAWEDAVEESATPSR
jgi:peptidoglycan-N-acetylglucosamine deacetylase